MTYNQLVSSILIIQSKIMNNSYFSAILLAERLKLKEQFFKFFDFSYQADYAFKQLIN